MPLQFRDTPFNAETIRRLASPAGTAAARATGNTGQPAGINPFLGRALRNSAASRARQATSQPRQATSQPRQATYNPLAGRTLLSGSAGGASEDVHPSLASGRNPYTGEQVLPGSIQRRASYRRPDGSTVPGSVIGRAPSNAVWNPDTGFWHANGERYQSSDGPGESAPSGAVFDHQTGTWTHGGRTYSRGPDLGGDTRPIDFSGAPRSSSSGSSGSASGSAPVAAQASPDVPQIGGITPRRSTAPDPGSPATLARPEAPNVDPLTLPEARQRTVANRSQDLGHLQSARSRRSVRGPRGSFNMADTARRTLLGSL